MDPKIKYESTSDNVSLFEETPLVELVDVWVHSDPGSGYEVKSQHVDEEKGEGVKVDIESLEKNSEGTGEDPEERQGQAVVFEEVRTAVEGCELVYVLHENMI